MTEIKTVAVLGAGLMGHGIAQVATQVGKYEANMRDVEQRFIDGGMNMIRDSLQRFVKKAQLSEAEMNAILARIHPMLGQRGCFKRRSDNRGDSRESGTEENYFQRSRRLCTISRNYRVQYFVGQHHGDGFSHQTS